MSYTVHNFKTKKALKNAVRTYIEVLEIGAVTAPVRAFNPGLGPDLAGFTGKICLEGPHYPSPHTWYAEAELKDGVVVKVK